jgi:hypothetical protein
LIAVVAEPGISHLERPNVIGLFNGILLRGRSR